MSDKKRFIQRYLSLALLLGMSNISFSQALMYCSNNNYSFQHMHDYLYVDADYDGYGGTQKSYSLQCTYSVPTGYSINNTDCNDSNASINPGKIWYRDADGDSYGTSSSTTSGCTQPTGYVSNYSDCNDSDGSVAFTSLWYRDADGDGYGTSATSTTSCTQPSGYVHNSSDYNDGTNTITNIAPSTFYRDADGDGYGSTSVSAYCSVQPSGYVTNNSDCNDNDASLNPNTPWFRDNDGDGYGGGGPIFSCSQPSGYARNSGDCNDYDSSLNPATVWYRDADGDGYGTSSTTTASCGQPSGYVRNSSDYNDGTTNITNIAPSTFYRDADSDGYGSPTVTVYYSVKPGGYVTNSSDCNDGDATLNPATTWYRDADGDGYGTSSITTASCSQPTGYVRNSSDYNDGTTNITNIAPQTFYRDADADGYGSPTVTVYYSVKPGGYVTNSSDCNDGDATLNPTTTWYRDADGDGYGTSSTTTASCGQPSGYVRNSSDYNDGTVNITNIAPSTFYRDADGDGYGSPTVTVYYSVKPTGYVTNSSDCNDGDATLNPTTTWYRDADGDGYGTSSNTTASCGQPSGYVRNSSDYNDGTVNITNIAPSTFYRDADGDSYGSATVTVYYSVKPGGYVTNSSDCNDGDATLNPTTTWYRDADGDGYGTSSITTASCSQPSGYVRNSSDYNDGTTNITNIAPSTFYRDADGDSYGSATVTVYYSVKPGGYVTNSSDCNDGDATLNPNTPWFRDNDGDGYGSGGAPVLSCTQPTGYVRNSSDYDDTTSNITNIAPQTFYRDADGDGYGSPTITVYYSVKPTGYVTNSSDCADGDATLNPTTTWYRDADGDGYGTSSTTTASCVQPTGYVRNATDCVDTDASVNPNTLWYADVDGDGYGSKTVTTTQCSQPIGYIRITGDYDDTTVNITNIAPQTFYADGDGDGFGNPSVTKYYSVQPTGYLTNNSDCNDGDATINPNTVWYADVDGDGYGSKTVTKTQCSQPLGYIRTTGDFDDSTVNITNIQPQTFYADSDGDGFGNLNATVYYSAKPATYVTNSSDYDDGTVNITNIAPQTFYADSDGDGFGNPSATKYYSVQPSGYLTNNLDCDDTKSTINPNTKWYADVDADGLGDAASFVTQCTAPAGKYVLDNTDNCPLISGTSSDCGTLANPAQDMNYIITRAYKQASSSSIASPTPAQATVGITYYDGLGRPMQQIANQQSNTGKDIVTHIEYDTFGRQTKEYLPFVGTNRNMAYESSAQSNTLTFYNTVNYENTANPFSEKALEASPLSRVLEQAAPGNDWSLGNPEKHTIKLEYQTNTTDEVKRFTATTTWNATTGLYDTALDNSAGTTFYEANQLYKNVTFDENSAATPSETNGSTVEFKNKEGKVVLKRTYATTGSVESSMEKHDTYYVYDIYGNLTYVIPPLADMALTQAILDDLCYQYQYDARNRLVAKKLPGKQWEFMVYDKLDRVVATGPAFSPFSDVSGAGWMITKYDVFNRAVYTGWSNSPANSTARSTMQQAQNAATTINESKQTGTTIDAIAVNYSNDVVPTTFKLLTVNYYDDYAIPNVSTVTSVEAQTVATATKGLATGSWMRVPTTTAEAKAETSYILYDAKYRPIRSYTTNYLGGYTGTDSKLDAFSGQLQYTVQKHKRTGNDAELTVKEAFTYSAQDRLLTHTHQINGGAVELLADNTYDELGKLTSKKVGNTSAAPLQKVDYSYNIRGWLKGINDIASLSVGTDPADLFSFKLNYNTVDGSASAANKLYNGNIAETFWSTATDGGFVRNYGYQYDNLNRLKDATYQKSSLVTNMYNEKLTYDKNGNIVTLKRNGDSDEQAGTIGIDDLAYTYATNSNKLMRVTDAQPTATSGFKDGNTTGDDYMYDANGNMTVDKNKNITSIVYNHLNLPTKIVFATGNIVYIYNAAGQKVQKVVTENTTVTTTDYLGGYQYKNTVLQYFPTAEGYVEPNGSSFKYIFHYKDHLGNIRLSYTKNPSTNALTILDENNYYPFGLKHSPYNAIAPVPENRRLFNGKELQEELGLNMYDYGWRNYMPDVGRWSQSDPLLNDLKFAHDINDVDEDDKEAVYMSIINDFEVGGGIYNTDNLNPYGYGYNNPVSFDDPDGRCPSCIWGAIIGAGVEYGSQVVTNYLQGKTGSDAWTNVDMGKVVISAGVGAVTGGISGLKAIGTTAKVYKAIAASATVGMGEIVQQGYENGTNKPVNAKKLAIEVAADKLPIPKIKTAKLDGAIKVAEKVANRAERVGASRVSRAAAIKAAKQEVSKLTNQKAAKNVANEVVSSTAKQVIKEPIKNK